MIIAGLAPKGKQNSKFINYLTTALNSLQTFRPLDILRKFKNDKNTSSKKTNESSDTASSNEAKKSSNSKYKKEDIITISGAVLGGAGLTASASVLLAEAVKISESANSVFSKNSAQYYQFYNKYQEYLDKLDNISILGNSELQALFKDENLSKLLNALSNNL